MPSVTAVYELPLTILLQRCYEGFWNESSDVECLEAIGGERARFENGCAVALKFSAGGVILDLFW